MESETYSQSVYRQFVCRQPGAVPFGAGFSLGLQNLVSKIESLAIPAEPVRAVRKALCPPGLLPGRPDDHAAYDGIYPEESLRLRRFYNLGAGSFGHPYWTNVDRAHDWYEVIPNEAYSLDIDLISMTRLPIEDNTAELVYSGHLLEHLPDESAHRVLREAYRILKPGGLLRVSTPDILLEYRAFKERDWPYFSWRHYHAKAGRDSQPFSRPLNQASIQQLFLYRFASHVSTLHVASTTERIDDAKVDELFSTLPLCEALDYCTIRCDPQLQHTYPGNHISWWSFNKMRMAMLNAGFRKVFHSGYGQSFAPPMRNTHLFDRMFPAVSLYVEARK